MRFLRSTAGRALATYLGLVGLVIWHYYVDGRIWKFSQDPELRDLLKPAAVKG